MNKFERRHYNFLADFFWQIYNDPELYSLKQVDSMLKKLMDELKEDNPNFKPERFEKRARSFQ